MPGSRPAPLRRRWLHEGGGEKGPTRPESHRGVASDVGSAGGGPPVADLAVVDLGTCEENGDSDSDSTRPGSIPSARSKWRVRRSFSASRRSTGRRLAAVGGDGHGGELGLGFVGRWGEERPSQREKRERGGGIWVLIPSPRTSVAARIAAGDRRRRAGHRGASLC
jgi:hypothetical protein